MDSGNIEEMGEAVLAVRRVRDVFRDAGWPERLVLTLPDVTLGVYLRRLEQPRPPVPWGTWPLRSWPPMTSFACPGAFDPVANMRAGLRYIQERREYRAMRRWPLSPAPSSPHGDPMASLIGRR